MRSEPVVASGVNRRAADPTENFRNRRATREIVVRLDRDRDTRALGVRRYALQTRGYVTSSPVSLTLTP